MNDDWRLRIDLHDQGFAHRLGELLEAEELEHDLKRSFHDRVVVSVDGPEVFCYTGTRDQAEAAEKLIGRLAQEHGWTVRAQLRHWHPTAERWEDPDAPLPTEGAGATEERADRIAEERQQLEMAARLYLVARKEHKPFSPAELGFEFSIEDVESYLEGARVAADARETLKGEGQPQTRRAHAA